MDREVLVDGRHRVVPVVEGGRREDPAQPWEAETEVRVQGHRLDGHEHQIGHQGARREAQHEERHEGDGARHDHVDQMQARARQPVHRGARVVDRVEAPEPGHGVEGAVDAVLEEIRDRERREELERQRLRGDPGLETRRGDPAEQQARGSQREQRQHLHQQVAHEEVREVRAPAEAQDALGARQREGALERHEDQRQHQQIQHEPVEAEVGRGVHRSGLDPGAAERDRGARAGGSAPAQTPALAEQHRERAEPEREHERREQRRA